MNITKEEMDLITANLEFLLEVMEEGFVPEAEVKTEAVKSEVRKLLANLYNK